MSITGYPPGTPSFAPVGVVVDFPGPVTPAFWLDSYGQSLLRSTYAALFSALVANKGAGTVTLASPGVWTTAAHGLTIGDPVFVETTGALPTGMSADVTYYVMTVPSSTTFTLGTTRTINVITGAATVTTAVNTSGSQSGVHTVYYAPYEVADATHFYLPDYRGRDGIGIDNMGGSDGGIIGWDNVLGLRAGEGTHTVLIAEMPSHSHAINLGQCPDAAPRTANPLGSSCTSNTTGNPTFNTGGGGAHNTIQPGLAVKKIIYAGA